MNLGLVIADAVKIGVATAYSNKNKGNYRRWEKSKRRAIKRILKVKRKSYWDKIEEKPKKSRKL